MADMLTPEHRSWNMSRIKGRDTKPEVTLRSMLHRAGYRFRLHDRLLPGRPDIVLPRYHAAIFVNGCFWHRHPNCSMAYTPSSRTEFWTDKFSATVARDSRNEAQLRALGWKVITVWECELKRSPQTILNHVAAQFSEAA